MAPYIINQVHGSVKREPPFTDKKKYIKYSLGLKVQTSLVEPIDIS